MQQDPRIFDLDTLVTKRELPKVKLNGKELDVQPLNGASLIKLSQLDDDASGTEHISIMYDVVQQLLPDLTREEVLKLTPEQVGAVTSLAQNKIEQVRRMLEAFETSTPQ